METNIKEAIEDYIRQAETYKKRKLKAEEKKDVESYIKSLYD